MTVPRGIAITARWPWDGSSVPMEYRSYRFDEGRYLMWTLGTACSDHRPVGPDWLVDTGPKMFTVAQAMDGEVLTFAAWPMSESDAKSRRRAIESTANLQFAVVVTDVLEVHPCKVTATQRIDGWPRPVALHPVAYRFCGGSVREVRDCEEWLTPP